MKHKKKTQLRTYWNGERCLVRRCLVEVGVAPDGWWFAELTGTNRKAVEVNYQGERFYLDDEDGAGWYKVTRYQGSPDAGHRGLVVARVLGYRERGPNDVQCDGCLMYVLKEKAFRKCPNCGAYLCSRCNEKNPQAWSCYCDCIPRGIV